MSSSSGKPNLRLSLGAAFNSQVMPDGFPSIPPSPTTAVGTETVNTPLASSNGCPRTVRSGSTHSSASTIVGVAATNCAPSSKCTSPSAYSSAAFMASRINFEGSWLDIESDSDDEKGASSIFRGRRSHNRRKSSGSSVKGTHGSGLGANLKEMTRRSSMHFRKLTSKMSSSSVAN
ncbi:hypothetical protein GGI15_003250 [Coemansia interrupta]|uniref:Uncharacterized protein n=1 Tax=Coemansia interrupta TaxID=1126814 RepID=A0A9W8LIF0_9FUNG|nr:hypothetical protein GGI15_003250 [Coemansia interrupta]